MKHSDITLKSTFETLQITRVKSSQHLLLNLCDFKFFSSSENGSAMPFRNSKLFVTLIVVPYILACEIVFLRKRRYFAKVDKRILGLLVLDERSESLYISSLAVAPEYRRQGIARRLLKFSEKAAEKLGKNLIELNVLKRNVPARRLYEKYGFAQKTERRRSFVMQKEVG